MLIGIVLAFAAVLTVPITYEHVGLFGDREQHWIKSLTWWGVMDLDADTTSYTLMIPDLYCYGRGGGLTGGLHLEITFAEPKGSPRFASARLYPGAWWPEQWIGPNSYCIPRWTWGWRSADA